jgi:hypothetical protein
MLGDKISDGTGQVVGTRVVSVEGGSAVVEVTFQGSGTTLGETTTDMGTYISESRPDGTLFGSGQGVSTTADGASVTWHGDGVGRMTGTMAASFRGAIFYETTSEKFASLTSMVGVFEFDVDESGKVSGTIYEWK